MLCWIPLLWIDPFKVSKIVGKLVHSIWLVLDMNTVTVGDLQLLLWLSLALWNQSYQPLLPPLVVEKQLKHTQFGYTIKFDLCLQCRQQLPLCLIIYLIWKHHMPSPTPHGNCNLSFSDNRFTVLLSSYLLCSLFPPLLVTVVTVSYVFPMLIGNLDWTFSWLDNPLTCYYLSISNLYSLMYSLLS